MTVSRASCGAPALSLTGNLEDLPLLDILQIVSFSKKTGYLSIRAGRARAPSSSRMASWCAPSPGTPAPGGGVCGSSPVGARGPDQDADRDLSPAPDPPARGPVQLQPDRGAAVHGGRPGHRAETLATGINPQELLLDLARGIDEDRRDSQAAVEESFAADTSGPPFEGAFRPDRGPTPPPGRYRWWREHPPRSRRRPERRRPSPAGPRRPPFSWWTTRKTFVGC